MAQNTGTTCRNQVIYSVFVRAHTPEGTFQALRRDLPRIRDLGAGIIWLMPIHPIGETARKGTLGSPYAIRDYRAVNPEFGTLEDFRSLVDDIHRLGMGCIIDVVYHHTSPDSLLAREHPDWFYHREDGSFGNKVGDWSDIIDLDYTCRELWDYQIETLCYWLPLRCGPPGAPGLLAGGPGRGGKGSPRLSLAGGNSGSRLYLLHPGSGV